MGYKLWTTNELLTSSDLNSYLMKQTVISCTSGTRPGSPQDGMLIFETDTRFFRSWNSTEWLIVGSNRKLWARRTTDLSRTSNTTVTADTQLQITNVPANTTYIARGMIAYNGDSAFDMKGGLFGPSGSAFKGAHRTASSLATSNITTVVLDATILNNAYVFGCVGTGDDLAATIDGIFNTGASGGTFGFQWAQANSGGTATTVLTNSYIQLIPLG